MCRGVNSARRDIFRHTKLLILPYTKINSAMYKSLILVALIGSAMIAGLSSCSSTDKKEAEKTETVLKEAAIAETGNAEGEIEDRAARIEKKIEEQGEHTATPPALDDTITVAL